MGVCFGKRSASKEDQAKKKADRARNKKLEKDMQDENDEESKVNKLLLLGAGESGKSTLFKQMISIYGTKDGKEGFPESERKTYTTVIFNNVITSIQVLLENVAAFGGEQEGAPGVIENPTVAKSFHIISKLESDADIGKCYVGPTAGWTPEEEAEASSKNYAAHITDLWADPAVQRTFVNRAKFQLHDSAKYFFDNCERVGKPGYIPNEQDVLRSRVRTTGIVENNFSIENNNFKMFDVGGQRNERKKWIHCFENVTAVLFVGVLSEYDLVLYEDEKQNRMEETLNLFNEIIESRWFRNTSIILFLNKRDLFEEKNKIGEFPLSQCCEIFKQKIAENKRQLETGETNKDWLDSFRQLYPPDGIDGYKGGCEAIKQEFEARNCGENNKLIYTHITCATDKDNVTAVFEAVKDIIIRNSLLEAGLV